MKLRVKKTAEKGHRVGGVLYAPGRTLPGEWDDVPPGMAHKLEQVESKPRRTSRQRAPRSMTADDDG